MVIQMTFTPFKYVLILSGICLLSTPSLQAIDMRERALLNACTAARIENISEFQPMRVQHAEERPRLGQQEQTLIEQLISMDSALKELSQANACLQRNQKTVEEKLTVLQGEALLLQKEYDTLQPLPQTEDKIFLLENIEQRTREAQAAEKILRKAQRVQDAWHICNLERFQSLYSAIQTIQKAMTQQRR